MNLGIADMVRQRWPVKRPKVPALSRQAPAALTQPLAIPFFLPPEAVLVHAIPLPDLPPAARRAAAGFAVEDLIAQPLEQVRVVLGPQYPEKSGTWLVAVVDQGVLADAIAQAGPSRPVLAAVMRLPVPAEGWAVALIGGQMLIRRADGSGFAIDPVLVLPLWRAQGEPALTRYGDEAAPQLLPFADPPLQLPAEANLPHLSFDLAAVAGRRWSYVKRPGRLWAAGFAGVAICAHLALTALDVVAHKRLAAQSLTRLATAVTPHAAAGEDPVTAATRVLAAKGGASAPAFLTLAATAIAALPPPQSGVSLRGLRFDETSGAMVLAVIAPDIPALQAVEAALAKAGHAVTAGPASSRNGAAEAEMTLTAAAMP